MLLSKPLPKKGIGDFMAEKHLNEKFIDALKYMNATMKADIKAGH